MRDEVYVRAPQVNPIRAFSRVFGIVTEEGAWPFLHNRHLPPRIGFGYINARDDGGFAVFVLVRGNGQASSLLVRFEV